MDDSASRSSLESASTTDEYVLITPSEDRDTKLRHGSNDSSDVGLNVPGNMSELKSNMEEAFREGCDPDSVSDNSEDTMSTPTRTHRQKLDMVQETDGVPRSNSIPRVHNTTQLRPNTASRSMSAPAVAPHTDECTLFNGVTYLGSTVVEAPCSEVEASNVMTLLKEQLHTSLPVLLSIPTSCEGMVKLLETGSQNEIASYRVQKILFCARGDESSAERDCFSFTNGHSDGDLYQCHVFKCQNHEAVAKVLYCFAAAFRRVQRIPSYQNAQTNPSEEDSLFLFDVSLEIKEEDSKGVFNTVPRDKVCFKVRQDFSKRVIVTVTQVSNKDLAVERCFGLLISPGRNVKYADMNLLDTVSMGYKSEINKSYEINGLWDPKDPVFEVLNSETPKATRVFVTVAVDLVIWGIEEPVRFVIETKMRIFPSSERFWYFSKKPFREQFLLRLRELSPDSEEEGANEKTYEVISLESATQIERKKATEAAMLAPSRSATVHSLNSPADESEDNDEPLLSGSGDVTKDCAEDILVSWGDILAKWRQNLSSRPKQLVSMIRRGIPEALRGEVWQLLAGCVDREMMDHYKLLITRESPAEQVILRDINRTFPAHEFFRESGGNGQDSLYKITKAYSVYDEEVGYCQGLSFLAASLLLHMPEEQAFCVLVAIMYQYGLRDLFRNNFAALHLKFYQLERLIEEHIPDLYTHFQSINLEAHMFASQWFLTLFTAKFPLLVVFQIIDLVLCEGSQMIFNIAIALLKESHRDLLCLDFESTLKYFRVSLPKRYRSENTTQDLIHTAVNTKISAKKIKKLEKEYEMMKEQEAEQEDPLERMERDNQKMYEGNLRLEQENDDLAHELVTSKIALRRDLDQSEDKVETLSKELEKLHKRLADSEEEKKRLTEESLQLKDMCRRELDRAEAESERNITIISEYRQIRSQLSERLELQQDKSKEHVRTIMYIVNECEACSQHLTDDGQPRGDSDKRIETETTDENSTDHLMGVQMRELELELAQTKLKLVESECNVQDLEHKLHSTSNELHTMRSHWLHKTITSFKEVTTKKDS